MATLTNAEKLARELYEEDRRHLNTQSDSEVLLNIFAHELQKFTKPALESDDIFEALIKLYKRCQGAFGGGFDYRSRFGGISVILMAFVHWSMDAD